MRRDPRELGARCDICPFSTSGRPCDPVTGDGPSKPIGILVGEMPSRDDAETGRPFIGQTGRMLDEELHLAGLAREQLYVLHAVACRPPGDLNERAFQKAVAACRPALLKQLAAFDPATPVLAMGKYAAAALTGKFSGAMRARGFIRAAWTIPQLVVQEETKDDDDS